MIKVNGRIQLYPVLRVAVSLVIGILLGEAFYGHIPAGIWYAVTAVLLAVTFVVKKNPLAQSIALLSAVMFLGGCLVVNELDKVYINLPDSKTEFSGVIVSQPEVRGKTVRCDMLICSSGRPVKIKASFYRTARSESLEPGNGIVALAKLNEPRNYGAADFDYRRYLLYHGYVATAFINDYEWDGAAVDISSLSYAQRTKIAALRVRSVLLERLRQLGIDGETYAVLAAMTLGERVSMSDETTDEYSISGAMHVLSLSGLHLGIIYAMLTVLFMRWRRSVLAQVLVVCSVWIYIFIVGMPVSAVRSAVMLSVYSVVTLLNRDRMSLNVLSLAATVVLVSNPLYLYDVGCQMSFISVAFILIFYQKAYNVMPEKVRDITTVRMIWQMCVISMVAQLGVAPLVALYFGRFSCYFLLSNFIVIPASTLILYGTAAMFLSGWLPVLQSVLVLVLAKIVVFMNAGISFVASLPGASIDGIKINALQTLLIYIFIFSMYFIIKYIHRMVWKG